MNAKEELLKHIGAREVKYVVVFFRRNKSIQGTLDEVLPRLDFEYTHGWQELEGTVWYSDGTWSERGEYDGAEWWEHRECPPLPNDQVEARRK